jgi:hypothetical membrane protein
MPWSAAAGIAAPIWFTILVIIQSLLQPDYSQIALPISALAAWPLGWMQQLNFVVFSVLLTVFVIGLHRRIQRTPGAALSLTLLLIGCAGPLLAGLFSWQRGADDFLVPAPHRAGAIMTFLGWSLGLMAVARRMARDERWRDLANYVLGTGTVMLLLFIVTAALAIRETALLHDQAGLLQRVTLLVWFPCVIVVSLRLHRVVAPGENEVLGSPILPPGHPPVR